MFNKNYTDEDLVNFFYTMKDKSPVTLLFYMVISLGTYLIFWLYDMNKKLLELESDGPNPDFVFLNTVSLPAIWFLFTYFIKVLFFNLRFEFLFQYYSDFSKIDFSPFGYLFGIIEILGWIFIIVLILRYFFDFCYTFAKITKTDTFTWFVFLSGELFAIIFLILGYYGLVIFAFFTLITIPAMQDKLNMLSLKFSLYSEKMSYYQLGKIDG